MEGLENFVRFAKSYKASEMIFSEFERGDTFYFIISGRVRLVKVVGEIEKTLDILQPSEMFGEMAILENSPRSATAIAMDDVKILEFNRQNFDLLMKSNPQIALRLLKMFIKRIYDQKRRFMIQALDNPQARIADVFLMLDETMPDIDRTTTRRDFKTTVEGVAHWVGMNTPQVRNILGNFEKQHRIEILPDRILVKNINDFERFVNSSRKQ
ncbi:MAG: Crp/Fnr family transcriptional regulator [Treponema sp.]|jgi:CRP-like cAMP-binding protein|nr:Crp/Fnr family transcriptional regulator [Treponema sp.]